MNMAENLHSDFRSRVEGVAMIGPVKESLAVGLHIILENEEIAIPRDRELIAQIHSIRKSPTNAGYSRYDTETNARAHADVLWALALAAHAAGINRERKRRRPIVTATIV
jgi:phage FluMu gp28-like protein